MSAILFIVAGLVIQVAGGSIGSVLMFVGLIMVAWNSNWSESCRCPQREGDIIHRHEHHEHVHHHHADSRPMTRGIEIARELPDGSKIAMRQIKRWH